MVRPNMGRGGGGGGGYQPRNYGGRPNWGWEDADPYSWGGGGSYGGGGGTSVQDPASRVGTDPFSGFTPPDSPYSPSGGFDVPTAGIHGQRGTKDSEYNIWRGNQGFGTGNLYGGTGTEPPDVRVEPPEMPTGDIGDEGDSSGSDEMTDLDTGRTKTPITADPDDIYPENPPGEPPTTPTTGSGITDVGTNVGDFGVAGSGVIPDTDQDPWDPTSWLNDYSSMQTEFNSITNMFQAIENIPQLSSYLGNYSGIISEIEKMIESQGRYGLRPFEEEYSEGVSLLQQQYAGSATAMMNDMVKRGIFHSSETEGGLLDITKSLNTDIVNLVGKLSTYRQDQARGMYENAVKDRVQIANDVSSLGLNYSDMAMKFNFAQDESNRLWKELGLKNQMEVMGVDTQRWKEQLGFNISQQRLALEEKLGLKDIDLRQYIAERGWDFEQVKLDLMQEQMYGDWDQGQLDRDLNEWQMLLQNEISTKRNDIDLMNVMGTLSLGEWDRMLHQAELDLQRWKTKEEIDLMKQELGQDYDMFLETQAFNMWAQKGQWANNITVADLYAKAQDSGSSWLGDLLGFVGDIAPFV